MPVCVLWERKEEKEILRRVNWRRETWQDAISKGFLLCRQLDSPRPSVNHTLEKFRPRVMGPWRRSIESDPNSSQRAENLVGTKDNSRTIAEFNRFMGHWGKLHKSFRRWSFRASFFLSQSTASFPFKLALFLSLLLPHVCVCVCLCAHACGQMNAGACGAQKVCQIPGGWTYKWLWVTWHGCWDLRSHPSQEQYRRLSSGTNLSVCLHLS